jgi:hypothetical protein
MKEIEMKYITRDLLTLLISLFILTSCEAPNEIGLDIDPANQVNSGKIDTSTVRTVTVLDDSLVSIGLSLNPIGVFQDPLIGTTEANLSTGLTLSASAVTFGSASILDSAVLVLKYGNEFYGDYTSTYTIDVRQLNEKFNSGSSYFNTKKWDVNSQIIGSKTINPAVLGDSMRITTIVKRAVDTQKLVASQIRIPISSSFINKNFFTAASDNFLDQARFNNLIKGLYISVKKNQPQMGGLILLDLSDASVNGLDLYFRNDNSGTIDTNFMHFDIVNTAAASSIYHDYSPSVKTQLNNPLQQFSTVYLQPMGGLRTKVSFPHIQQLKNLGKIVINKAELEMYIEGGSDNIFNTAPRVTLYRTDIADQRQPVPDNNFGQTGTSDQRVLSELEFGGFYDTVKKRYTFVITSYIQDLVTGKLPQYDTYIAPIYTKSNPSQALQASSTAATAGRSLIIGGNSLNPNIRMRLNIIYTRVD